MFGWLSWLVQSRRGESLLHPAPHFEAMLDRERSRADRSKSVFSLLAIQVSESRPSPRSLRTLCATLEGRLRATDLTGWLPEGRIGVILPDTSREGACELIDDLREELGSKGVECAYELFHYPTRSESEPEFKDLMDDQMVAAESHDARLSPAFFLQPLPMWKRGIDVIGASLGLVVLSPILLLTALAIKLTSPGPVLFFQARSGLGGRPFTLYKFRTMCVDAEERQADLRVHNEQDGPAFKIKQDPRVTPLGRILRRSCLDELPQLLNILRGDMTLVGPRPLPCHETDQCKSWELRRLDVTPGLTCIWQAGARRVPFAEWMRMDIRYARQRTPQHDIKLLGKTLVQVLRHRASD